MPPRRRVTPEDLHREAAKRSGDGKRAKAPCGHNGEHVTQNYIRCVDGCEGDPAASEKKPGCLHKNAGWFSAPWGSNRVYACLDCHQQYNPIIGEWRDPS